VQTSPAPVSTQLLAEELLAFWRHLIRAGVGARVIDELGLSLTQIKVLDAVAGAREELTMGVLADRLGLSVATTSRTVEGLLRRALLERREDPADRRAKRVRLTEAGRRAVDRVATARLQGTEEALAQLPPAHRQRLHEALVPILELMGGPR
jgi:DNA-binding MarR family transcriptional regulator